MKRALILSIAFLFGLSACGPVATKFVTPAPLPLDSTPVPETDGQTLRAGDTAQEISLPVPAGTPMPWPVQPITPSNASLVTPLARWGTGTVFTAIWSQDGKSIAVATAMGIYLYDAFTHQETRLIATTASYATLDYSADGTLLASGSEREGTIILWDVASGKELRRLNGHNHFIGALKFSPAGNILASVAYQESIKLWDVNTGRELFTLKLPQRETGYGFDFSPDGKILASGYGSDSMALWDVSSGKVIRTLDGQIDAGTFVEFSPQGNILAFVSVDHTIKLWDMNKSIVTVTLTENSAISAISFLPDGKILASKTGEGPVKLWNTSTGQLQRSLLGTESDYSMSFSPDGKRVLTFSLDSRIHVWDIDYGVELLGFGGQTPQINGLAFSPAGKLIAFRDGSQKVHILDSSTGRELRAFTLGIGTDISLTHKLAFSPDGALLASGTMEKSIKLWDVNRGGELRTFTPPLSGNDDWYKSATTGLAFSADGTILAAVFGDNTITVWDVASGGELRTMGESRLCYGTCSDSLAISPDGEHLGVGYDSGSVILWGTSTGKVQKTIAAHSLGISNDPVNGLAFSPDGSILASGARDTLIKLWDVSSGQELRTLLGHTNEISSLAFSPDGRLLASGSWDSTIRLWDVSSGKELNRLALHNNMVRDVAFSSDGRVLASGSEDGTVAMWGIPPRIPIEPEASTQPAIGSVDLVPTSKPTRQPTPDDIGVEKTTIPVLAAAANIEVDKWSRDGNYLSYFQWGHVDPNNAEQVEVSLNFLRASDGEVCPGLQENTKFQNGYYSSDTPLSKRTAWLLDNRLLYITLEGKLQVLAPCSNAREDWSSSVVDRVISISYSAKPDGPQLILVGEGGYWLFSPGTRQAIRLDLPLPVPLNDTDPPRETRFDWSPWEQKLVSTHVEKRQGKLWIIIDSINSLTGKVSRVAEIQGSQQIEFQYPYGLAMNWLSKTKLVLDNTEMGRVVIDIGSHSPQVIPVFPDLINIEPPTIGSEYMWDIIPGPGDQDYHLVWEMLPEDGGQFYIYHAESGQVEQFSPQQLSLFIFPNGVTHYIQPMFNPSITSVANYKVVHVDSDEEPSDLVVKGHTLGQDGRWDIHLLPGEKEILISSSNGVSLLEMQGGKLIHFWEPADKEKYQFIYFYGLSPDRKTDVGWARYDDPEGKSSLNALFWLRLEP